MKYLVIPKEESLITVDYVIESDEYTHSLYYSGSDMWASKLQGKLIGSIYDDGKMAPSYGLTIRWLQYMIGFQIQKLIK